MKLILTSGVTGLGPAWSHGRGRRARLPHGTVSASRAGLAMLDHRSREAVRPDQAARAGPDSPQASTTPRGPPSGSSAPPIPARRQAGAARAAAAVQRVEHRRRGAEGGRPGTGSHTDLDQHHSPDGRHHPVLHAAPPQGHRRARRRGPRGRTDLSQARRSSPGWPELLPPSADDQRAEAGSGSRAATVAHSSAAQRCSMSTLPSGFSSSPSSSIGMPVEPGSGIGRMCSDPRRDLATIARGFGVPARPGVSRSAVTFRMWITSRFCGRKASQSFFCAHPWTA